MPKNSVTDPITDQEIAFAHLVLSGTMNDGQAAEVAGLNPSTAAYTKSKPRVQAYMAEHRAAVKEKLVDQEAEGLRNLNLGRDQILARLWQLANFSPETTRGSITGQIKAMSMIVAIEGLIPNRNDDRRLSPAVHTQPAVPSVNAQMYASERQPQAEGKDPGEAEAVLAAKPNPQVPEPVADAPSPNLERNHTALNPFVYPKGTDWVPDLMARICDVNLDASGPLRLPTSTRKGAVANGR
jgi:hypothetical protein